MEGVETYHFPSTKKLKENVCNKAESGCSISSSINGEICDKIYKIQKTKELRQEIHKLKKKRGKKQEIDDLEKNVHEIKCGNRYTYQSSYHLRTCANQHKNKNGCKMYDRNLTRSENIMTVGLWELTTKDRGKYKRASKSN